MRHRALRNLQAPAMLSSRHCKPIWAARPVLSRRHSWSKMATRIAPRGLCSIFQSSEMFRQQTRQNTTQILQRNGNAQSLLNAAHITAWWAVWKRKCNWHDRHLSRKLQTVRPMESEEESRPSAIGWWSDTGLPSEAAVLHLLHT